MTTGAEPRDVMQGPGEGRGVRLSRRQFIARAAALGAGGSAMAAFLAACGASATATAVAPTARAAATQAATAVPAGAGATVASAATQVASAVPGAAATVGAAGTQVAGARPAGSPAAAAGPVRLTDNKLVLAVMNDQSGVYADLSGKNATQAVRMAVEDFQAKYGQNALGGPIEVIDADHQNKPEVANTRAQEFYDRNQVDVIFDVPTSSCALAVAGVAKEKRKLHLNVSAATTELTGAQCNKYTFHWAYDTWMLANGTAAYVTKNIGKKWYILYPNYAFGQDMDRSFQDAIKKNGGEISASDPTPWPATGDFSSFLLKAPSLRPDVLGAMQAGGDLVNLVKQYNEFKLRDQRIRLAIGLLFDTDIKALGPDAFQGVVYTTPWIWSMDDEARQWADKYKQKTGSRPTFAHSGNYSAAWQYLEAVRRAGTDDADAVVAALENYEFSDVFARNAKVRAEDHLVVHDVLLAEVKKASDVKEDFDYATVLSKVPAAEAFRPLSEAAPLCKK